MRNGYDLALMNELEARSGALGHRSTVLRRQVLDLLLRRGGHASAYQLVNDLPTIGRAPSPPQVYRALDFLIDLGLVMRLSATNTFIVAPVPPGSAVDAGHTVFLICTRCNAVEVLPGPGLQQALDDAVGALRYQLKGGHTEVNGICAACQAMSDISRPRPART